MRFDALFGSAFQESGSMVVPTEHNEVFSNLRRRLFHTTFLIEPSLLLLGLHLPKMRAQVFA
jgi:hypothetical protein